MPKKQRSIKKSIKYRDDVEAAVYSMSNEEAAQSLRATQMAEENARAKAAAARARAAAARAEARAEARAAAAERRRPGLEKDIEDMFGNIEDVDNDLRSRDPDTMLTYSDMTPGFQELFYDKNSSTARALKKLEELPSGNFWLKSAISKRPYYASLKKSSKNAMGRKLYKTRNKKSRRGRQGKRTTRRRKNRNLFTRKRNNIAYSLKRGRGGGHDPYPTFTAVEPPFISRIEDYTREYLTAIQQYQAALDQYYKDLANWRARLQKRLKRPLTGNEMYGIFDQGESFPVPAWTPPPTGQAAAALNYQHTPGPL